MTSHKTLTAFVTKQLNQKCACNANIIPVSNFYAKEEVTFVLLRELLSMPNVLLLDKPMPLVARFNGMALLNTTQYNTTE